MDHEGTHPHQGMPAVTNPHGCHRGLVMTSNLSETSR
jgi:hypothetical protein